MVQPGSILNVIDNSGAKSVCCIRVQKGHKRRYAYEGDVILVSVRALKSKRRAASKVKKGDVLRALIVRSKINGLDIYGKSLGFLENSVILLNSQNKPIGARVSGSLSSVFSTTKFLKVASISNSTILN